MSRYMNTAIIRDSITEKRRLSTIIIPTPTLQSNDLYIQVIAAERLDKLAYMFYEDESLWWIIASANGLGKGTLFVPPGINLRIPDKSNIQRYINETNASR